MASENNTNQEIDIRRILGVCLRHWYWFVIGVLLCGGLGVLYFLRTTPKYQTQASIMLRQSGDSPIFSGLGGGALDMEAVVPYNLPTVVFPNQGTDQLTTTPSQQYYLVDTVG